MEKFWFKKKKHLLFIFRYNKTWTALEVLAWTAQRKTTLMGSREVIITGKALQMNSSVLQIWSLFCESELITDLQLHNKSCLLYMAVFVLISAFFVHIKIVIKMICDCKCYWFLMHVNLNNYCFSEPPLWSTPQIFQHFLRVSLQAKFEDKQGRSSWSCLKF